MADAADLTRLAMSLAGTAARPHVDRTAFYVKRIYVTLAPDGLTANLMYTPDQQQFKCMMYPDAFSPLPNKWGQNGATTVVLDRVDIDTLRDALELAWQRAK